MSFEPFTTGTQLETHSDHKHQRSIRFAWYWMLAVCGIFTAALILTPSGNSQSELLIAGTSVRLPELCQFKQIFGSNCPGCGMTRSFVYSARLQLADAWSVQPIGTLLAILLAASVPLRVWQISRLNRGQNAPATMKIEAYVAIALVGLAYGRWFWNVF